MGLITIVLINCAVYVSCDTIHFTNSKSHLERSYKNYEDNPSPKTYTLDVPGSNPITIIEAEPNYDYREPKKFEVDDEDRKTKDYIVPGSSEEKETGRCLGPSCQEFNSPKNVVYSPDLLNKFLVEYADKIKNADQKTKDLLHQIEVFNQPTDRLYQKKKITEKIDIQLQPDDLKKMPWEHSHKKNSNKHPFGDRDGWVTLEAVPWSKSKITKWQANTHKVSKPNVYAAFDTSNDRFPYPNQNSNSDLETDYESHPFSVDKPTDVFEYRPNVGSDSDWNQETPRPSWNKPQKPQNYHADWNQEQRPHRPDCDHDNHEIYIDVNRRVSNYNYDNDGIITDGKPSNFPAQSPNKFKDYVQLRPTPVIYSGGHPSSHPSTGDGEWVLLSTTKGYQFPRSRQRSLSISPATVTSKRSVQLTVLPAPNTTKENITTSHGGLLEVDPSFQTVEESRRRILQLANSTRLKGVKIKNVATQESDGSAVIAAVGAGLVPATVAMIMPMVMGRKKRNIHDRYLNYLTGNVTQHPLLYESTIPRTLK